jgi:hypothetical protein
MKNFGIQIDLYYDITSDMVTVYTKRCAYLEEIFGKVYLQKQVSLIFVHNLTSSIPFSHKLTNSKCRRLRDFTIRYKVNTNRHIIHFSNICS